MRSSAPAWSCPAWENDAIQSESSSHRFRIPSSEFQPAYLTLHRSGELEHRAQEAIAALEECRICPRMCGARRLDGYTGSCKGKRYASVSSAFPHFGEEDCLRGRRGSGTIFFEMCNLHCVFCQNFDISHAAIGAETHPQELAGMMLALQAAECHNINLVTPDHFVPQILEALVIAAGEGLTLPLVYNTSGYTSPQALAWLDGVVDIYMPDFKTADHGHARTFLQAKDYPEVAQAAVQEMHRQTGDLCMDQYGIALRGVLVRHLVMPGWEEDSAQVMAILANISPDTFINIMGQYRPAGKVRGADYPEINRLPTRQEIETTFLAARQAGLWRFDKH